MGGVMTDRNGRTSLEGLWACGEVASTGAHGANRLASNSLLEAVVFAARIAEDLHGLDMPSSHAPVDMVSAAPPARKADSAAVRTLREIMSRQVGVLRDAEGLRRALTFLRSADTNAKAPHELRSMAAVGLLIAVSALNRQESRGSHERLDYPTTDAKLKRRTFITLEDARRIADEAIAHTSEAAL
jgi:L-aspartate oxidase